MNWDGRGFEPRMPAGRSFNGARPSFVILDEADLRAAERAANPLYVVTPHDEPEIRVFGAPGRFTLLGRVRMAWRVLRGHPMFDAEPLSATEPDATP